MNNVRMLEQTHITNSSMQVHVPDDTFTCSHCTHLADPALVWLVTSMPAGNVDNLLDLHSRSKTMMMQLNHIMQSKPT